MMDFFYDLFGIYGPEFIGPKTLPYSVFVALLKRCLPAGILIAAVLLARQLLRKAPKWISCALWALVALRLICPFTIESPFSVVPDDVGNGRVVDVWMDRYIPGSYTVIYEGEAGYDTAVENGGRPERNADGNKYVITGVGVSSVPETVGNRILPYLFCGWVFGMTAMLLYALVSYLRLKRRTAVTVPYAKGILLCDEIDSPFILGVFCPRVYLPSRITEPELSRVLAHEKAHVKRHDHWWKPLGFLLLSVYWFNPLVWVAYILLWRDIEMACDERVVRDMNTADRADYAQALLDCSRSRRVFFACPLAFGEVGVKERVKGVLNYKKPAFWLILIAMIACAVLAVCLMTDPFSSKSLSGKLGVSMDMAVAEHHRSSQSEGRFIATDYDVLLVSKKGNETTVYAWVLYEEYISDGSYVTVKTGSRIPSAVTFDTSAEDNDSAAYPVIEYWEPRDGTYYAQDIRAKFPYSIRRKALDPSGAEAQHQRTLRAARENFFGISVASVPLYSFAVRNAEMINVYDKTEEPLSFAECVNAKKLSDKETVHLPVFRIDSAEELNRYEERFGDYLIMNKAAPGGNYSKAAERYDEAFFETQSLLIVYISGECPYHTYHFIGSGEINGEMCIRIYKSACAGGELDPAPERRSADWIMAGEIYKDEVAPGVMIDAIGTGDPWNESCLYF